MRFQMDPALVARLENVANRMENILLKHENPKTDTSSDGDSLPPLLVLLDEALNDKLLSFYKLSDTIGGDVADVVILMKESFDAHRDFFAMACGRPRPEFNELIMLAKDVNASIENCYKLKEERHNTPFANHLSAVESAGLGLGWIALHEKPAPYIEAAINTAVFYINRILVAYKGKEEIHVEWAKALKDLWMTLHGYVKKNHTTGLVWNSQPGFKAVDASQPSVKKTAGPPPPPPPPPVMLAAPSVASESNGRADLLESLNTGLNATSRLKKVTPEMQTHKNPSLRADTKVAKSGSSLEKSSVVGSSQQKHEPVLFWDGKIWRVDYQNGNLTAVVKVTDKKESIYIYKCTDSIIKIKGKANAITLDGCRQVSVVFDGLVAQCEVINSQSIQIQTLGELPTVSIQKTDGCHVYLSRAAQNAQIVASKSSEMNISAQLNDTDDEYTEMAIPEQFVTCIKGKKLETVASEIV